MSVPLGNRTKKVTTYGKRNTRIVSLYRDLTPERPTAATAYSPAISTRPALGSKASYENVPPTPVRGAPSKSGLGKPLGKSLGKVAAVDSDVDSPVRLPVPRRRFGRPIIPASPSTVASSSPLRPTELSEPAYEADLESQAPDLGAIASASFVRPRAVVALVEIPTRQKRALRTTRRAPKTTDLDAHLVQKLDRLDIADTLITPARISRSPEAAADSPLARLTAACTSTEIISFSAVLSALGLYLPNSPPGQSLNVTKAGEASYSEVYAVTTKDCDPIMMKIIPIKMGEKQVADDNTPELSDAAAVAQEVMVTQRMSGLKGGGFVHFHAAYVVKGAYTLQLLKQWDAYKTKWGSDNHRPSCFGKDQHYAVLCLSDGGLDLESFAFDSKSGWRQAAGVFWQAAHALARAEEWTSFEHRDLHEGQILIDIVASTKGKTSTPIDYSSTAATGIKITIIDFGLSRLEDATGGLMYSPIPDNIMDGEGAQWDVYRSMKQLTQGDWETYRPKTNVMWLRYILDYIFTNTPSLTTPTRPAARRGTKTKAHLEAEAAVAAHEALMRARAILDASCAPPVKKRGKSAADGARVEDAQELVQWGREEGFLGAL